MKQRGFTLLELLVVIAIIGVLSSVVLASLNASRDKAKAAQTASQVKQLRTALIMFVTDTGSYPSTCNLTCTTSTDPLNNALGVSGWAGPYFPTDLSIFEHQWGGHMTVGASDLDGDSIIDLYIFIDDDSPQTNSSDDQGTIPSESMVAIDTILDDGNISTGEVRGGGAWSTAPIGELVIRITP